MAKIRLTITQSACRSGWHTAGEEFIYDGRCPPLCAELWHAAHPYVFALQNGGMLDCGEMQSQSFDIVCPDGGRVRLHGERTED